MSKFPKVSQNFEISCPKVKFSVPVKSTSCPDLDFLSRLKLSDQAFRDRYPDANPVRNLIPGNFLLIIYNKNSLLNENSETLEGFRAVANPRHLVSDNTPAKSFLKHLFTNIFDWNGSNVSKNDAQLRSFSKKY